ncbi:MAG: phage portal protein [Clostridia bacterium]|nr:phage portal protein [Clostridia bacterium]
MFEEIKNFFGKVIGNMFDKNSIRKAISSEIAVSDEMSMALSVWREMYEEVDGLHLPASIAFEMARLVTVEMNSVISGSKRAEFLNDTYKDIIENIRIPVEYGCAKGGLVMKPYVSKGKILVDFIQADKFLPTSFDESGNIRSAVFIQTITRDGGFYTRLEKHSFVGDTYEISNKAFFSRTRDNLGNPIFLADVPEWQDLAETISIGNVKNPLFGYFKPAIANCIDPSSPLGVSVFANAVNLIEDANRQYERLLWEFESGERALIANAMAFKRDKNGKPSLPDKRLYRTLDVDDMDFFREWSPKIRIDEIAKGLNRIFRQIEFNCGFAYGTISEINDTQKTAEEIRASKQRSYATVSDNQKALKKALLELVYAMDVWCTLYDLAPKGECSVSFDFDDSIEADRKTQFEEKQALVDAGIMAPWEFRMWYFGEDEDTAKKSILNK